MALIHTTIAVNGYAELNGLSVEEDGVDFVRAQIEIVFRGTEAALRAAFPKGNAGNYPGTVASGAKMVCAGVRISKSRFGFLWAAVLWVGLVTTPSNVNQNGATIQMAGVTIDVRSVTNNSTTKELNLPVSLPTGGNVEAGLPFNLASPLVRSRTRIISPAWARTFTGILIVARSAPPQQPRLLGAQRPAGLPNVFNDAQPGAGDAAIAISQTNWFDGILSKGGWCLRNFQVSSAFILGDWLLCRWTADFEWIDRCSPS